MGKTRKDSQQQAAKNALRTLADKYVEYIGCTSGTDDKNFDMHSIRKENGFIWDDVNTKPENPSTDEKLPKESKSEAIEMEIVSSSSVINQQPLDYSSSPRFHKPIPSKQLKDDFQGAQLFTLTVFIFLLALLGVFYPYNRGAMFTALVVIYALTSGIAGYTATSFYCQLEGANWL